MARRARRGPSGAALVQALERELERGWPAGLTVLTGEDVFHLDAAQRALLDHLAPPGSSEFALTVFAEGKAATSEVVAAARSVPMFESRRVVLVRDVGVLDGEPDPILAYAGSPPEHSHLVVRAPKLDLRRPLHKALAGAGRTLEFAPPAGDAGRAEVLREIAALAEARGLALDRSVAEFLAETCAGDLYRVRSELDKLDLWLGPSAGRRRVGVPDAREVAFGGAALTTWEAADAIFERDLRAALTAVRRLMDAGEEPLKVLGGLAWRLRVLLQGKAMIEGGAPRDDVLRAVRAWYFRGPFLSGLAAYSMAEVLAFPAALLEADRSLKSRALDPVAVMESLVRTLVESPRGAAETP